MNTYIDEFLRLSCSSRFLASRTLPNHAPSKEITEIMGAMHAIRDQLGPKTFGRQNVLLLDIGCGRAPRAATLLALMTRWSCIGIDPRVRRGPKIPEVTMIREIASIGCGEIARNTKLSNLELLICLNIHGHAPIDGPDGYASVLGASYSVVRNIETLMVAIPCCVPLNLPAQPVVDYEDPNILSPQRRVKVWRGLMHELAGI